MSNPLADMEKPDVFFCIGTNMTECHPVAATRLKKAVARGAKLIVADPRRIPLVQYADLYLPLRVGSDVALLLGMAHVIARDGLVNQDFMNARTTRGEAFLEHIKAFTPDWAAQITGVPAKDIETAARWYAMSEKSAIYYTLGITEHISGVDNVQSLCNLALMTGHVGREGTGIKVRAIAAPSRPITRGFSRSPTRQTRLNSNGSTEPRWTSRKASPRSRLWTVAATESAPC